MSDITCHGSKQSNPMLRGRNCIGGGRINHEAPVFCGCRQINIIDSNTGTTHHLESAARGLEHLACDLGATPDYQGVAERDLGAELLGAQVVRAVHVGEFLQELETRVAELFGDEDCGLGVHHGHYYKGLGISGAAAKRGNGEWGGKREPP